MVFTSTGVCVCVYNGNIHSYDYWRILVCNAMIRLLLLVHSGCFWIFVVHMQLKLEIIQCIKFYIEFYTCPWGGGAKGENV